MELFHLIPVFSFLCWNFVTYMTSAETVETSNNTTNPNVAIIRRRPQPSIPSGGGRYSLMNSRFNRRPRKKNLDKDQLLDILGSYFDEEWMSIEEPLALSSKDPDRGATYVVKHDGAQHSELVRQIHLSNLTLELAALGGQKILEDRDLVLTVEKYLLQRASCPVRFAWEDIGALFWPRYIKRGECASVPGTCSWPPGMHCVPADKSTIHVLRWQCKLPKGKGRRRTFKSTNDPKSRDWQKRVNDGDPSINLRCHWIRVPYPITTECYCTC
ncbi:noggin-3-like [Uloborus diversus]|uniref:noggin-3-like n=1 Tax=Uloborus diversus TaxID=327109 RepID=UPI00240A3571|nr:noggin-3-like [Uloborus diversus]